MGAALLAVVVAVAVTLSRRGTGTSAGRVDPLKEMEGVIDRRGFTYDPVRSDLAVRASKALESGDAKRAEGLYREAVAKWPDDADTHASLAACLFFQKDYDAAQAEYGRALELDPKSVRSLYGSGCVAYKRERFEEARGLLEKALAIDEKDGASHRVLGLVHHATGNPAAAIAHYERAIELADAPGDADEVKQWLAELKR